MISARFREQARRAPRDATEYSVVTDLSQHTTQLVRNDTLFYGLNSLRLVMHLCSDCSC